MDNHAIPLIRHLLQGGVEAVPGGLQLFIAGAQPVKLDPRPEVGGVELGGFLIGRLRLARCEWRINACGLAGALGIALFACVDVCHLRIGGLFRAALGHVTGQRDIAFIARINN